MSRILLIGHNPPPFQSHSRIEAAHYRTWQFLEPLLLDGQTICLCVDALNANDAQPAPSKDWGRQLVYHSVPLGHQVGWVRQLQRVHDTFQPDCIVAVGFDRCLCTTRLRTDRPVWMDIYGDYLTIIQAARHRAGSDRGIPTSIAFVRQALRKGDIFSACSTPQKHALVGELAMAGRLNWRTFGYQFVHVILPGALPTVTEITRQKERLLLSSHGVTEDSFVVLWCGGYNTWTDVETLFASLEWAMAQEARVHYVSVGASTYEAADNVYIHLLSMVEQSQYRDRLHMLGWRPWTEIADFYRESDVGLNIDAPHYETIYGTRTRLVEMMAAGLPVITSSGCELGDLLSEQGAGLAFEPGDWQGLGNQILALARDRDLWTDVANTALSYADKELSFAATTTPVRAWVKAPRRAPDKASVNFNEKLRHLEYRARSAARQIIWRVAGLYK